MRRCAHHLWRDSVFGISAEHQERSSIRVMQLADFKVRAQPAYSGERNRSTPTTRGQGLRMTGTAQRHARRTAHSVPPIGLHLGTSRQPGATCQVAVGEGRTAVTVVATSRYSANSTGLYTTIWGTWCGRPSAVTTSQRSTWPGPNYPKWSPRCARCSTNTARRARTLPHLPIPPVQQAAPLALPRLPDRAPVPDDRQGRQPRFPSLPRRRADPQDGPGSPPRALPGDASPYASPTASPARSRRDRDLHRIS